MINDVKIIDGSIANKYQEIYKKYKKYKFLNVIKMFFMV